MSDVTTSIGLKFERFTKDLFPELRLSGEELNVPDFYHPSRNFWVEAKVGNILWGVRIKRYQIEAFRDFKSPVIYAVGLHNLDNAYERLVQKTERGRQRCLDNNMGIREVHFITREVMERLWEKEKRMNKKGTIEYCMIKRSTLMNVYLEREFKRDGRVCSVRDFYGLQMHDLSVSAPRTDLDSLSFGAILDPRTDGDFMLHLREKRLGIRFQKPT